jgi:hypothetical protein
MFDVLNRMRLLVLLFTGILTSTQLWAQQPPASSSSQDSSSSETFDLPVNLDRIKLALQREPTLSVLSFDERPMFRVLIRERQRIEDLLATLDFKTTPAPAGGLYMAEMQRQWWPAVDHPLNQPYAAFNQGELMTVLVENLAGKYLGGRAINAVTGAERTRAESAAREEVQQAIHEFCLAQPHNGSGIAICSSDVR